MFVENDTGSTLELTFIENSSGDAIDLALVIPKLRWRDTAGVLQERNMAVVDAPNGVAAYTFAAGELYAPKMTFEAAVETLDGFSVTTVATFYETVRARI